MTTPDCLDAETLAAWMEDQLAAPQRARAEAHVAGCARCQSMFAVMARTADASATAGARPRSRFWSMLPWAAPLTAAATAAALWLAVRPGLVEPTRIDQVPAAVTQGESAAAPAPPAEPFQAASRDLDALAPSEKKEDAQRPAQPPAKASKDEAKMARAEAEAPADALADFRKRARPLEELQSTPRQAAPPEPALPPVATPPEPGPAAAAPPPAPAAPAAASGAATGARAQRESALPRAGFETGRATQENVALGPIVIASPDPKVRWRIAGGTSVQRSTDGGATWALQATGSESLLTAGAAPSPTVCWIVGRAGTVLLTTDTRTWRRVTFPEAADLASIRATSADEAAITTADGRTFATKDGGKTWRQSPQVPHP